MSLTAGADMTDLRAIAARGLAMFHGYATYELEPNLAWITARPQTAFRPERLVLPRERADRWLIHEIKIANQSQFPDPIPIGGDVFTADTAPALDLDRMRVDQDVQIAVEYVGDDPEGEVFVATLVGSGPDSGSRMVLPLASNIRVLPSTVGMRVVLDLDDQRFVCVIKRNPHGLQLQHICVRDRSAEDPYASEVTRVVAGAITIVPPAPITVSLHVAVVPRLVGGGESHVLFGLDERTNRVVFELVHGVFAAHGPFTSRCEIAGYLPKWWDAANGDATAEV